LDFLSRFFFSPTGLESTLLTEGVVDSRPLTWTGAGGGMVNSSAHTQTHAHTHAQGPQFKLRVIDNVVQALSLEEFNTGDQHSKKEKSRGRGTSVAALVDEVVAVDLLEALHLHRAHGPQVGQLVQHLRLQHTRADATVSRVSPSL
jgi:hypothetical protein